MRIRIYLMLLLCVLSCGIARAQYDDSRITNQILVMLQPAASLDEFTSAAGNVTLKEVLVPGMKIYLFEKKDGGAFSEEQLAFFNSNKAVKAAQYNHRVKNRGLLLPNDPSFANQWNMHNTGQNGGFAGADIDAPKAWDINHSNLTKNGDTIVIAVIDDYFDTTHADLNFYSNPHEIAGDGIDNDGNGYIDDIRGWNAYDNNANVQNTTYANHPNHVSGIVGAKGNNGLGVAGVCWGVKILPVAGSSEVESDVVKAYAYVVAMRRLYNETNGAKGAFIVASNSSFGTDQGKPVNFPIWCALYDTMGTLGIVSVTSTANVNWNVDNVGDIPTTCPSKWMVAVNSTESHDYRASSGFGPINIDISAPGQGVYSTVANGNYSSLSGTSMAAPHVTGAVAAMFAEACPKFISDYKAAPDTMALVMRQWLLAGVEVLSKLKSTTVTEGRLNLYRAIMNTHNYNCDSCNFSLSGVEKDVTCNKEQDGEVTLALSPVAAYQFAWSDTNSNASRTALEPGFYGVTVQDAGNCTQQQFFTVNEPDTILVSGFQLVGNGATRNLIVTATAGLEPLTYSLDGNVYQSSNVFVVGDTSTDFTVYIKNRNGCVVVKQYAVLGMKDAEVAGDIAVFPNPSTGLLNLKLNMLRGQQLDLTITDMWGRVELQQMVEAKAGEQLYSLNVTQLANGLYALHLPQLGYAAKIMVKH